MPHVPDTVPGKRVTDAGARTEGRGQPSNIRGGSRMQESCPYGSVRGRPVMGVPTAIVKETTFWAAPVRSQQFASRYRNRLFRARDRWFESVLHLRRVRCEPH